MNNRKVLTGCFIMIMLPSIACAAEELPPSQSISQQPAQTKETLGPRAAPKEAWEIKWEKTVKAPRDIFGNLIR